MDAWNRAIEPKLALVERFPRAEIMDAVSSLLPSALDINEWSRASVCVERELCAKKCSSRRIVLIDALGKVSGVSQEEKLRLLSIALTDQHPDVRDAAVWAMVNAADAGARDALAKASSREKVGYVQDSIMEALEILARAGVEAERQMANLDRALAAFGSPIEEGSVVTPSPGLFRVLTDEEDAHDG